MRFGTEDPKKTLFYGYYYCLTLLSLVGIVFTRVISLAYVLRINFVETRGMGHLSLWMIFNSGSSRFVR